MMKMKKIRRNFVGVGIGVFVTVASLSGCVNNGAKSDNTDKEITNLLSFKKRHAYA